MCGSPCGRRIDPDVLRLFIDWATSQEDPKIAHKRIGNKVVLACVPPRELADKVSDIFLVVKPLSTD